MTKTPPLLPRIQCERCNRWWATNTGTANRLTRRFCPSCIPHISHQLSFDPPSRPLKAAT